MVLCHSRRSSLHLGELPTSHLQFRGRHQFCDRYSRPLPLESVTRLTNPICFRNSEQYENLEAFEDDADNAVDARDLADDLRVNLNRDELSDVTIDTLPYIPNAPERLRQFNVATTEAEDSSDTQQEIDENVLSRRKRQANATESSLGPKDTEAINVVNATSIRLVGFRLEESEKEPKIVEDMIPSVLRNTKFSLRLFGEGFTKDTEIAFTHVPDAYGVVCNHLLDEKYKVGSKL